MRAPVSSTSFTVAARSSAVAIGYGTDAIWSHRSTAMMSAPSEASFTAWARPWPRAAPVMNAVFPLNEPMSGAQPPLAGIARPARAAAS